MQFHDIALILVAFFSEVLGTLSGFGSSTFFVPIALLLEKFKFVLALTAILHCFGNLFKIVLFRKDFEWKSFLLLAIPAVLFTGLGALLTVKFNSEILVRSLGFILMFFAFIPFIARTKLQRLPKWVAATLAGLSGFTTGLVGTGGAIRGLALAALQLPKNSFVAISSGIDVGGDFIRAAIYITNGFMEWSQWYYLPFLAVAAWAGAKVGKKILSRINQNQFEKTVAVFIFISGLLMAIGEAG